MKVGLINAPPRLGLPLEIRERPVSSQRYQRTEFIMGLSVHCMLYQFLVQKNVDPDLEHSQ